MADDLDRNAVDLWPGELGILSERALKGLALKAVRTLWEDGTLWRGVADEAKRLEAIRAAHRTDRGEWYAVIAAREYAYDWAHITAAHEKCSSRKAAVEAGRRRMAEKIDWLAWSHSHSSGRHSSEQPKISAS